VWIFWVFLNEEEEGGGEEEESESRVL